MRKGKKLVSGVGGVNVSNKGIAKRVVFWS